MKKTFLLTSLLLVAILLLAQTTTFEYYDNNGAPTTEGNATVYREIVYNKHGQLEGIVKEYWVTGELLFEGKLKSVNPDILYGLCTWYYKNGQRRKEGTYNNGVLEGRLKSWSKDGKEEGILDSSGYFFSADAFLKYWKDTERDLQVKLMLEVNTIHLFSKAGGFLLKHGDYGNSLILFFLSHDLAKKLQLDNKIATSFNNIATVYYEQGLFEESLLYYQKAMQVETRLQLNRKLAITYNNIGSVYSAKGLYKEALKWYRKAATLRLALNLEEDLASSYNNIGSVYESQGLYEKALEEYYKAINIHNKTKSSEQLAATYNNIGSVFRARELYDKALEFFQKSDSIYTVLNLKVKQANSFNNLGTIYNAQGLYEQALESFNKAVEIFHKKNSYEKLATTYNNIGSTYHNKKQFKEAISWYEKAVVIQKKLDLKIDIAASYNNLGIAYSELQLNKKAINQFKRALHIHKSLDNDLEKSISYNNIAIRYFELAEFDSALVYAKKHILLNEFIRSKSRSHDSRQLFTNQSLNALEVGIYSAHISTKEDTLAFQLVERAKARGLVELLAEKPFKEIGLPADVVADMEKLSSQLKAVNLELAKDVPLAKRKNLITHRDKLFYERQNLENQIRHKVPELAALIYPKPVTYPQVQKKIAEDEVLINYYCGSLWTYIFLIDKEQIKVIELGETKEIIQLVESFRLNFLEAQKKVITTEKNILASIRLKKNFHQNAHALYKSLWYPIEQTGLLANKKILIAPDSILYYLPFELLIPDKKQKKFNQYDYLIKNYELSYVSSATVLHIERSQRKRQSNWTKDFLGIGVTNFEDNRCYEKDSMVFSILPSSQEEILTIANNFDTARTNLLINNNNYETTLKSLDLTAYRYLHFSTHGLINTQQPNFSRILLTPSLTDDGCLHLYEVFELSLQADLVTLSACETGLGKLQRGEGMQGFTKALLYAGTSSIILSLWEVVDVSTKDLFVNYYANLAKDNSNKYRPLRAAQLKMIEQGGVYANPYYWGAFVFVGER